MPPMSPQTPCRQLSKLRISSPASLARQSITKTKPIPRFLSTPSTTHQKHTNPNINPKVPPESPFYIPVPTGAFSEDYKAPRVRGSLPIPRKVFAHGKDVLKSTADHIARTAPLPTKESSTRPVPPESFESRRRQMAANRRENLQAGLTELWHRKRSDDRVLHRQISARRRAHRLGTTTPDPDHDVLTRSTILSSVLDTSVAPDPDRFDKAEKSRAVTLTKEAEKREQRRNALMELYVNARDFIVDEKSLQAEVDYLFSEEYWNEAGKGGYGESNIWGMGPPPGLAAMLGGMGMWPGQVNPMNKALYGADTQNVGRRKVIAEELTGGKLE